MDASVEIVKQCLSSVVYIHAEVPAAHPSTRILGDERMGTGTVIDPSGLILTVNYVVMGAETIQVSFAKGRTQRAEIVAQDFELGLALLKVKRTGLASVPVASSDRLERGQSVFALGATGRRAPDLSRRVRGLLGIPARAEPRLQRLEPRLRRGAALHDGGTHGRGRLPQPLRDRSLLARHSRRVLRAEPGRVSALRARDQSPPAGLARGLRPPARRGRGGGGPRAEWPGRALGHPGGRCHRLPRCPPRSHPQGSLSLA